jgi:hypothetical protein
MSKITKQCKHCEKQFTDYIKKNRQYCSRTCSNENYSNRTKAEYKCQQCGNLITTTKSTPRKFCSVGCKNKNDSDKYTGTGNPNFGKRRPGMFSHTDEAKRLITKKVTASWKTAARRENHEKFLREFRDQHGYIPLHSPTAKLKAYEGYIQTLGTRKYGGWTGIQHGWYISSKTGIQEYYSSSYELRRMEELDIDDSVVTWTKRHEFIVKYTLHNKVRAYKPDFYIEYDQGKRVMEEIKGFVPDEDVEQYCSKVSYASEYFSRLGIEYFVNFKYKKENEVICG